MPRFQGMRIIPDFLSVHSRQGGSFVVKSKNLSRPRGVRNQSCTVMVIDDDPALQRLIQQTLAPGAEVLQEFGGASPYVESLEFDGIDLVILDYKMPDSDGLEVLRRIREKYEKLPVLFMTGFGDLELAQRALALGANEYFPKPFEPADLRNVISRWVPSYRANEGERLDVQLTEGPEETTEEENLLTARDEAGNELNARVIRFNARAVVVECEPGADFAQGTELRDTVITLGHRSMEVVGATVQVTTHLASRRLIEVSLPGVWQIEGFKEGTEPRLIAEQARARTKPEFPSYARFDEGIRERSMIPESLRATISDVEHILEEFYDDLEPFEKFLLEVGAEDRARIEGRMIEYAETRFFPTLTEAMNRFEAAAAAAEKAGIRREFQRFSQKRLLPHLLCSPFLSRVITKPIGVPGDYGILGQILGHPYEGHSLYARMLNAWAIKADPSSAYRHRISLLQRAIDDTVLKRSEMGERARILSMASGVAYEVQRFVQHPVSGLGAEFDLVDFSDRTLVEAKRQFDECRRIADPSGVDIRLRQDSVVELAKKTRRVGAEKTEGEYDLVYCAGLFDYLSERMCSSIVSYLYDQTRTGGKVIVSNYTPNNALRYFMGVVLDWELIHRTPDEFHSLMKSTKARDNYEIFEDDTRTELYAVALKG